MRYALCTRCVCAEWTTRHDPTNLARFRYYMYRHAYMGMVLNTLFPLQEVLRKNSIAHKTMSTQRVTHFMVVRIGSHMSRVFLILTNRENITRARFGFSGDLIQNFMTNISNKYTQTCQYCACGNDKCMRTKF